MAPDGIAHNAPVPHSGMFTCLKEAADLRILVHSVDSLLYCIRHVVPGLDHYDERALLLATPHDITCVSHRVDTDYLSFLQEMHIGPARDNIFVIATDHPGENPRSLTARLIGDGKSLAAIGERIRHRENVCLTPFIALAEEFRLAEALRPYAGYAPAVLGGNLRAVELAGCKDIVRRKAKELGVPVAPGETVTLGVQCNGHPADASPLEASVRRVIRHTGKVIVRGATGASGSSTYIVSDNKEGLRQLLAAVARSSGNSTYLVDPMFDIVASPNIQTFIAPKDGALSCATVSDQRLDGSLIHQGNVSPSDAATISDMANSALLMTKWMRSEGYTGQAGFDFVEYVDPSTRERRYILTEINPRVNGATYPATLMERFAQDHGSGTRAPGAFLTANVATHARTFAELRKKYEQFLFSRQDGAGLFPYNIGCLAIGKFTGAFLGSSRGQCEELFREFSVSTANE